MLVLFSIFLLRLYALRLYRVLLVFILVAGPTYAWWSFSQVLAQWLHPAHLAAHQVDGVFPVQPFSTFDPLVYLNPRLTSLCLMAMAILAIGLYVSSVTTVETRTHAWRTLWGGRVMRARQQTHGSYVFSDLHLATDTATGRPIVLDGIDRFMHMLVVGSTGAGKTSRILCKGIYQDLLAIANGMAHDVIVLEPDGGLVQDAVTLAKRLGIAVTVIDLRKSAQTSACFNPFAGGRAEDVASNLRLVLQEYMGKQEAFFQTAQYSVLQTIIDVQVPIWPESTLMDFAYLIGNPQAFREICEQVLQIVEPRYQPKRRRTEVNLFYEHPERLSTHDLSERVTRLDVGEKKRVLGAVRRYLEDTRSEASAEHLRKISGGLQLAIHDIASSDTLSRVLGEGGDNALDFGRFFEATTEPGRLVAVVTSNEVEGNFFGKLFLASLKQWALRRSGDEWERRPVYLWIDEFSRYTTPNIGDFFTLVRKYRIAVHVALQSRSQLKKPDTPAYLSEVEGNCRNRVYFPGLAPEDAMYLEQSLGTRQQERKTVSKREYGWLEQGSADVRVSTQAQDRPRFRVEDLLYGMKPNEAIFILMRRDQMQEPIVGRTTMAQEWLTRQRLPADKGANLGVRRQRVDGLPIESVSSAWQRYASPTGSGPAKPPKSSEIENKDGHHGRSVPITSRQHAPSGRIDTVQRQPSIERLSLTVPAPKLFSSTDVKEGRTAIPNTVPHSIKRLPDEAGPTTPREQEARVEPVVKPAAVDNTPTVTRVDLRTQVKSGDKDCPSCPRGRLWLNEDRNKWRCDRCGYERAARR